jgi:hypothetical protein
MRDPESLYSLTLPPSAIKTDKYIIVNGYGTPPKDRWFDLRKLTSFTYDEKSRAWTIVAPKQQLEARGVLDDAKSLTRAGSQ